MMLQNGAPFSSMVGAYNTYVGQRYVPIFDGEWSSTKNYEPLVIVSYNNNSYTSKQFVPAGTIPTNETYWALTGNYNGQLAQLQQSVEINTNDISSLTTINKRKVLLLGDSFGEGIGGPETGWQYYMTSYLDNYYVETKGGSGFIAGKTFSQMLDDFPYSDIIDIYIQTANNDSAYQYHEVIGAMNTLATKALSMYPYLQNIYVIPTFNSGNNVNYKDGYLVNIKMNPTLNKIYIIPEDYAKVAHNLKYYTSADNFHPNEEGGNNIAKNLASYVKSKTFLSSLPLSITNGIIPIYSACYEGQLKVWGFDRVAQFGEFNNGYDVLTLTYGTDCNITCGTYTIGECSFIKSWKEIQKGVLNVTGNRLYIYTDVLQDTENIYILVNATAPIIPLS